MAKHRAFNVDRFLDKFQGYENLLKAFCKPWGKKLELNVAGLKVPQFKEWLVKGEGDIAARDEMMEGLYQCYDLATDVGHEYLANACNTFRPYNPDPNGDLPVECLALKVWTDHQDAFNLAYAEYSFGNAQRFSIFVGKDATALKHVMQRAAKFQERLAKDFQEHKKSERVLVRHYEEGVRTNFVVYHEKRTEAKLIFKGSKTTPKVVSTVYRPLQQDFISYNGHTGQIDIEARFANEEEKLRQCFAESFFGDKEHFDGDEAADCLALGEIAKPTFAIDLPDEVVGALVELHFALAQEQGPLFKVKSKNMLRTLDLNGLRRKLDPKKIRCAVINLRFADEKRAKRVELIGSNKIKFNRATHADDVFAILGNLKLFKNHEREEARDTVESHDGAAARDRQTSVAVAGSQVVPKTRVARKLRTGRPR